MPPSPQPSGFFVEFSGEAMVIPVGSTAEIIQLGRYKTGELSDSATESISWTAKGIHQGYHPIMDITVEVLWSSPSTAGQDARLSVTLFEIPDGQVLTEENGGTKLTQDETDSTTANVENTSVFTFTGEEASLTPGVSFYPVVERSGAADSLDGVCRVRAVRVRQ